MTDAVDWHTSIATQFDEGYQRSPRFRERLAVWRRLIDAHVNADSAVLDAGCGPGLFSALAARKARSVVAFDASPAMVALSRRRMEDEKLANVVVKQALLGDDAVLDGALFDVILCSSVLEYVDDLDAAIGWLAGALKPGGALIVSMPNGSSAHRRLERVVYRVSGRPRYFAHVRHTPTLGRMTKALARHGLRVAEAEFYAAGPLVSALARPVGLARFADTLFVTVARKDG